MQRQSPHRLRSENSPYQHKKDGTEQRGLEVWKRSSKIKTSPSVVIGKSPRNSKDQKEGPGPGAYDLSKVPFSEKRMVSFKGNRLVRCSTDSPGPAAYLPNSVFSSKKYSFPRSKSSVAKKIGPDPTAYNIDAVQKCQAISFSQHEREPINDKSKQLIPGPGKYQTEDKVSKKNYSFKKAKKFLEDEQQYNEKQKIPGPGAYETIKGRRKLLSYKFTQALRNLALRETTPGPGSYNSQIHFLSHNGGIISQEKRQFEYANGIPGPGNYKEIPVESIKKRQPRASFFKAEENGKQIEVELGPGAYYKDRPSKIIGGVIGKQKRDSIENSITPSPVNYNPHFDEVLEKSGYIAFGKQPRSKTSQQYTPGPGYYQLDTKGKGVFGSSSKRLNKTQLLVQRGVELQRRDNLTSLK